jgi:DNA-binding HxlR family transcriptional regulator
MRSYGQYCAVAKALDLVGDRWNLLVVRELRLRGPCRYTDLLNGLPGIATNMLAERLRALERAGVLAREEAPPPVATTLFRLTARGEELKSVIRELGRWGAPLMIEAPGDGAFRSRWLTLPVELFLADQAPELPPVSIELRAGDEPMTVETVAGEVRARPGATDDPDLVLSGTPQLVLAVLVGRMELDEACAGGLQCEGDRAVLARLRSDGSARGQSDGSPREVARA